MPDCIFCLIAAGKIPSKKVFEDAKVLAFLDINPLASGHTLVIPKTHYETIESVPDADLAQVFAVVKKLAKKIKANLHVDGFNVVQNNYTAAGQEVPHFHVHIIPRKVGDHLLDLHAGSRSKGSELDAVVKQLGK